jgi:antitoxin VapB
MASVFIRDPRTVELVAELAKRRRMTKTEAVRRAVEADLAGDTPKKTSRERLQDFYRRHPRPQPTGLKADKSFYDWLSGEEDA